MVTSLGHTEKNVTETNGNANAGCSKQSKQMPFKGNYAVKILQEDFQIQFTLTITILEYLECIHFGKTMQNLK